MATAQACAAEPVNASTQCYVSTGRDVAAAAADSVAVLERAGVRIVTDTCTYITPIIEGESGVHMTNSAKWAYYAPANLGVDVLFASTADCVASAVAGRIVTTDLGGFSA